MPALFVIVEGMKYAAFLRGINVGGPTIGMSELKATFQSLGLEDVSTILQTGNVVFNSEKAPLVLKREIEDSLAKEFGYPAKAQLRSIESLQKIVNDYPFDDSDNKYQHYVILFEDGLENDLIKEAVDINGATEAIQAGDSVLYWRVLKGLTLKSPVSKYLTKAQYKTFHTNRNLNTLRKVVG